MTLFTNGILSNHKNRSDLKRHEDDILGSSFLLNCKGSIIQICVNCHFRFFADKSKV